MKFRVWNGSSMEYDIMAGKFGIFYVNPGEKKDGLDTKDTACINPFNTKYYGDNIPIMQSTEFKDKNNKEVYEGDILKYDNLTVQVIWEPENAAFQTRNKTGGAFLSQLYINNFEIIGNIFENPALLK